MLWSSNAQSKSRNEWSCVSIEKMKNWYKLSNKKKNLQFLRSISFLRRPPLRFHIQLRGVRHWSQNTLQNNGSGYCRINKYETEWSEKQKKCLNKSSVICGRIYVHTSSNSRDHLLKNWNVFSESTWRTICFSFMRNVIELTGPTTGPRRTISSW